MYNHITNRSPSPSWHLHHNAVKLITNTNVQTKKSTNRTVYNKKSQLKLSFPTFCLHLGNWWSYGTGMNASGIRSGCLFNVKDSQIFLWAVFVEVSKPLKATRLKGRATNSSGRSLATAILERLVLKSITENDIYRHIQLTMSRCRIQYRLFFGEIFLLVERLLLLFEFNNR